MPTCNGSTNRDLGSRWTARGHRHDPALHHKGAGLLWFDGRKCLLLAHVGTLFPVLVADVRKANITPLELWLANVVRRELNAEGLPDTVLGDLAGPVVVAKTESRQMLGFMNEMSRFADYTIDDAGGLARCDVGELNREQRRMLHNRDGHYATPLGMVAERLGHQHRSNNSRQA